MKYHEGMQEFSRLLQIKEKLQGRGGHKFVRNLAKQLDMSNQSLAEPINVYKKKRVVILPRIIAK